MAALTAALVIYEIPCRMNCYAAWRLASDRALGSVGRESFSSQVRCQPVQCRAVGKIGTEAALAIATRRSSVKIVN